MRSRPALPRSTRCRPTSSSWGASRRTGARHLTALGNAALARESVERSLAQDWSGTLVTLYCELPELETPERAREALARIERAERWLAEHPEDPQLLAALGRLCAAAELWGKAQRYLEAALSFEESRAAHLDLARLLERLGRPADAQVHIRRAAEMPPPEPRTTALRAFSGRSA